jgi:2-aminoadipate transaminase
VSVLPELGVISFARGIPSPDMFPLDELADCARAAIERDGRVALNYGPPAGYAPLREWIAAHHDVDPDQVLLTPGSLQGLHFVARSLVERGAPAVVEAPTYDRMLKVLAHAGAAVEAVPRTLGGLDLDRLHAVAASRPRLLYVLPTFHNPTGTTLTADEREALVDLAVEHRIPVFEDDPYALVRIDGRPQPTLFELLRRRGADELAVFSSSFSKTVAPGLRVGYLLLPSSLVAPVRAMATDTYVSPPILPQAQLHEFLRRGNLDAHLEHLRTFLRLRRDAMLDGLERGLPDAAWSRPEGGYFVWLELPGVPTEALLERARAEGVAYVPGSSFFAGPGGETAARLSFSFPTVEQVRDGTERLARVASAVVR